MNEEKMKDKLMTFAEKADYSNKVLSDGRLGKLNQAVAKLFDEVFKVTQDKDVKISSLLGQINYWIYLTHKSTGHDYKCILQRVANAIDPLHEVMEGNKELPKSMQEYTKKKLHTNDER